MKEYPFIKCLSPVYVPNRVTGEKILVGCGKCVSCLNLRNSSLALKCKLESLAHKYTYFVTLTYDETFIPICSPVAIHGTKGIEHYFISLCQRLGENGNCKTIFNISTTELDKLQKKIGTPHGIPYVSVREAQLFIKRLRKNLKKYSNENIRYFICGEYGPKHLRPHYHALVWFSGEETRKSFELAVNQSWKFGNTDIQLVQGDCSSYVASYVNCLGSLPDLYAKGSLRPFACHSWFLGEKFYRSQGKEIYKLSATEFIRRSERFNDSISEFTLWRSLKDTFYPRCRNYSILNSTERKCLYTLYACFQGRKKSHRQPYGLAEEILKNIEHGFYHEFDDDLTGISSFYDHEFDIHTHFIEFIKIQNEFVYGRTTLSDDSYLDILKTYIEHREYWKNVIYRDLLISKRFLEFVCNSLHPVEVDTKLAMIDYFYMSLDMANLNTSLSHQEEMLNTGELSQDDLPLFYDVDYSLLNKCKVFKSFRQEAYEKFNKAQKHKIQNDANRLLFVETGLIK